MVTDRKIRLPEPYPDENCYSILCRYAVRSGWLLSSNQASVILYGSTMPLSGLLYKPFRTEDLKRWNGSGEWDVSYGKDHSCLQYFTAFLVMQADHRFFRKHGFYDFPQKKRGTMLAMYLVGFMMRSRMRDKLSSKITEGMLMPYRKVLEED